MQRPQVGFGAGFHFDRYDRGVVLPYEIHFSRGPLLVSDPEKLLVPVVAVEGDAQLLGNNLFGGMSFPYVC